MPTTSYLTAIGNKYVKSKRNTLTRSFYGTLDIDDSLKPFPLSDTVYFFLIGFELCVYIRKCNCTVMENTDSSKIIFIQPLRLVRFILLFISRPKRHEIIILIIHGIFLLYRPVPMAHSVLLSVETMFESRPGRVFVWRPGVCSFGHGTVLYKEPLTSFS